MSLYKVEVTRIVKSTKPFVVQADDVKSAEAEAIAAACEEEEIGHDGGWSADLEWQAEALYHEPRVGDVVKMAFPDRNEACFRFDLLEINDNDGGRKTALIRLICNFTIKPTARVAYDKICLAETED